MLCHICENTLQLCYAEVADAQTGELFSIYACAECGLKQTAPVPANLDAYYAEYHGGRHGATADFCARRRIRWLEKSATKTTKPRKILDIGCGEGTFLLAAKRNGWHTVGVEMNAANLDSTDLEIYETVQAVGERHAANSFTHITLWHVLEHLTNPRQTLNEINDLLAPDGKLLIAVPDAGGFQARIFRESWLHLDVPRHLFHFDSRSLMRLLETSGYTVEQSWHQEFEYDLLGWSQSVLNRIFSPPNVFFRQLTNRQSAAGSAKIAVNFCLGIILTAAAVPLVFFGSWLKKGGTIIIKASKKNAADLK